MENSFAQSVILLFNKGISVLNIAVSDGRVRIQRGVFDGFVVTDPK